MSSRKNSCEETARRLKLALNKKGWTAQRLSDMSGVPKSSISQYINGYHAPSNIAAGKLGEALNVSPAWLMGFGGEDEVIVNKTVKKIISAKKEIEDITDLNGSILVPSKGMNPRKEVCHVIIEGKSPIDAKIKQAERIQSYIDLYMQLSDNNKRVVDGLIENLLKNQNEI